MSASNTLHRRTLLAQLAAGSLGAPAVWRLAQAAEAAAADAPGHIRVIPRPQKIRPAEGQYTLTPKTVIRFQSAELEPIGHYLAERLERATGLKPPVAPTSAENDAIVLTLDTARRDLGDEGYSLRCTPNGVTIAAPKPAGVFYGVQTLRQLLPAVEPPAKPPDGEWSVPCVAIDDWPRFSWRGYLLDPARHFRTKDELKRYIDLLAFQKLNRFQLHLTDGQGWRVEIKRYPKLTEVGARVPNASGRTGDGWFYTQDDVLELVAYAESRYVTIVPEIEMPGHIGAAVASYPELSCFPDKPHPYHGGFCVSKDTTVAFAKNVLSEVMELFPSPYIHVGADEVRPEPWRSCPRCGPRMQALLKEDLPPGVSLHRVKIVGRRRGVPHNEDVARLQGEFNRAIDRHIRAGGRRMVGWDEILDGGLEDESPAVVMAWRSEHAVTGAIAQERDVVVTLHPRLYLDNNTPLPDTYSVEPVPDGVDAAQAARVLGVQGNMWGERTPTIAHVDARTFPRLCAIAEIGWTAREHRDFDDFALRLGPFLKRLFEPNAVSLTTGKPATASHALPGHPAHLANDGRNVPDAYWATDLDITGDETAWWQVDLEEPTPVGRVVVVCYYGSRRYYGFTVQTSLDGETWHLAADRRDNREPSTLDGYTVTFDPRPVRYLRVTQTHNSANRGRHLVEVMAFEQ